MLGYFNIILLRFIFYMFITIEMIIGFLYTAQNIWLGGWLPVALLANLLFIGLYYIWNVFTAEVSMVVVDWADLKSMMKKVESEG